jgi:hypothetical protein
MYMSQIIIVDRTLSVLFPLDRKDCNADETAATVLAVKRTGGGGEGADDPWPMLVNPSRFCWGGDGRRSKECRRWCWQTPKANDGVGFEHRRKRS